MRWAAVGLVLVFACGKDHPGETADTSLVADTDPDPDPDSDAPGTGPITPDASCGYLDLEQYVVSCDGTWTEMVRFVDPDDDPTCPPYFSLAGLTYLDAGGVIAAAGCDASCVYRPGIAVMFLSCGSRGEYIGYTPGGPGQTSPDPMCPEIAWFSAAAGQGWYDSLEAFESANPCPE